MEHMQARQRLKQHHRARLGQFGLGFCDDNAARLQKLEQLYADARGTWEAEGTMFEPVIAAACHASTTDNELQTIGKNICEYATLHKLYHRGSEHHYLYAPL